MSAAIFSRAAAVRVASLASFQSGQSGSFALPTMVRVPRCTPIGVAALSSARRATRAKSLRVRPPVPGGCAGRLFARLVWRGHLRSHFFSPCDEFGVKLLRFVGLLRCEILLFADVLTNVVQFEPAIFVELHELPLAALNHTDRRGAPTVR